MELESVGTVPSRIETVVIGAGQAGLSASYHLTRRGREHVVLDAGARVGDSWRSHWDSLRLYSPARADGLPGMRFPVPAASYPTKDQMADFLETYATRFDLPVRHGVRVEALDRVRDTYIVSTSAGVIEAENVIIATGTFGRTPYVPEFAADLDPAILQLHSNRYQRPDQLRPGPVLVVGASHSGGDIAYEVGPTHQTVLCGHIHGEVPFDINSPAKHVLFPVLLFLAKHVLTMRLPVGPKMRAEIRNHGGPLIRVRRRDLARAGVELADARMVGVGDGRPLLDDGRVLDVANVVWCTGFRQAFEWIKLPVIGEDGWPLERRGVVESSPGLYFTGLAFQYAFSSMLVGGADRDAAYVVRHLDARARSSARDARIDQAA